MSPESQALRSTSESVLPSRPETESTLANSDSTTMRRLRDFYDLCWHLGGSQSDIAHLHAENIDWNDHVIAYARGKTGSLAQIHFGESVEAVLRSRPSEGPLFPRVQLMREGHRAKEFKRRCLGLGIHGVSLH